MVIVVVAAKRRQSERQRGEWQLALTSETVANKCWSGPIPDGFF